METMKNILNGFSGTDFLILGAGLLLAFAAAGGMVYLSKRNGQNLTEKKRLSDLRYQNMYRIFMQHRIISRFSRKYITSLTKRLSMLSVYKKKEIQVGAARYTFRLFCCVMAAMTLGCILFRNIVSVFLVVAAVYVYTQTAIERSVEATLGRIYRELKQGIASIRIEYKKSNSDVLVALEQARFGNRIAPIMDDLRTVLTSANPEEALTEFYARIPFKQIQTLAMICYNINNNGDTLDKYHNSTFDEAMLLMNSDINQKIEQMDYEKMKFRRLENMALIGIVLTVAFRYGMAYIMPGAAIVYNSIVGFLIQNGVILFSIWRYYTIAHAHLQSVMVTDDRVGMVRKLMANRSVRRFIHVLSPRDRKRRILSHKLKLCFSRRSVDDFYCEKYLYAAAAFAAVLLIAVTSPFAERKFLLSYTKSFDMMGDNSAYEDKDGHPVITTDEILEMDERYMSRRNAGYWVPDNGKTYSDQETLTEIHALIREYLPRITTLQLTDQVNRMETKYEKLQQVKFHWYYILLCYVAAFLAFRVPERALKKRQELAREEEEEEFLQLQIITMILAAMNLDTMEAIGHLAQIADIHKDMLTRCYYGYAANPMRELERALELTRSENFKLFLGKMKETVTDLSLQEAYADLASDREHICAERNAYIKERIDRRRAKAGLEAMQPMNLAIYGMMVFPLIYTGITGLMDAMSQVNGL